MDGLAQTGTNCWDRCDWCQDYSLWNLSMLRVSNIMWTFVSTNTDCWKLTFCFVTSLKHLLRIGLMSECSNRILYHCIISCCTLGLLMVELCNLFPGQARCAGWQGLTEPGEQVAGQVPSRSSLDWPDTRWLRSTSRQATTLTPTWEHAHFFWWTLSNAHALTHSVLPYYKALRNTATLYDFQIEMFNMVLQHFSHRAIGSCTIQWYTTQTSSELCITVLW